jgi:hypothetical protein
MAKKTVKKVSDAVADLSDTPTLGDDTVKEIPQDSVMPEADDTQSIVATDPEVIAGEPVEAELPVDDTPSADFDDAPAPVVHDPEPQRARVWPLLLGGVAAAVFGFLAARADLIDNFLPPSMRAGAEQSALAENLKSANSEIARLNGDVQNLGEEVANLPTPDTSIIEQLQAVIATQNDRISELEKRPVGTGGGAAPNYDAEFATLQAAAAEQRAEIDKLLADARLVEKSTEDAANSTLARAAATRIIAAIESGAAFDAALNDLEGTGVVDIPDALKSAAANGVAPLSTLQSDIPDVARAALAASRSVGGETGGGFSGFLQRSLGARSTEPREGSDPDAVLSRIEDAARNGRLTDAIAEAETLPPEGQAAMSDWLDRARTRQSVMSASESLMQRLAAN